MDLERLEALALADDRDAAVAALVPGSEDHAFWTAVRHQQRGTDGDLAAVDALLDRWRTRFGDTPSRRRIELRQRILRCDRDLARHAAGLAEATGTRHDHVRDTEEAHPDHASALDDAALDVDAVLAVGLQRDRQLAGLTDRAMPHLLRAGGLDRHRRRALLQRIHRTGLAGLIEAVVADREAEPDRAFGAVKAHTQLVAAELDELAARAPSLRHDEGWVLARIQRMRPPAPIDERMRRGLDDDALAELLDQAWGLVAALPPAFAPLRVHLAFHRLAVDVRRDQVDPERLLRYLGLPRPVGYAPEAIRGGSTATGALDRDFAGATGLPPVGTDEALVRAAIARRLELGDTVDPYAPFVSHGWLRQIEAETRLLAGEGTPAERDRWSEVLGPDAAARLRDRVDIDLLPTNAPVVGADEPVALHLALKHCWPLTVRVFRIHTAATGGDVGADVDLDGLVPGHEQVIEALGPPMRRVRHTLELPACDRPGTWVIELIGNGRASRAVVRKGTLHLLPRPSVAGLAVTVVGDDGVARPTATLRLGERELRPRADGEIPVPFGTTEAGPRRVLVCDGDLVVDGTLALPSERYALKASILVDRQALVPGTTASIRIRPTLTVGGESVTLAVVEEPYVEVTTVDRLGVPVRRRRPTPWVDDHELDVPLRVPEHLETLTIAIGGRVRPTTAGAAPEVLHHEQQVAVGTMHGAPVTEAAYLERSTDGFALRWLGKSGEPRGGRVLTLQLHHELLVEPLDRVLATDAEGRIGLGALAGVTAVVVTGPGPVQRFPVRQPPTPLMHVAAAGRPVVLPVGDLGPWQLVALRGGAPGVDETGRARLDGGVLRIDALPAGDYVVRTDDGPVVRLQVVPGWRDGWGRTTDAIWRLVPAPIGIAAAAVEGEHLVVRLANATARTRLHVVGVPFVPAPAFAPALPGAPRAAARFDSPMRRTSLVSGRDIGDEYRYVLDRRRRPRRTGNLLDKPSLLLNPWALRETSTAVQTLAMGAAWAAEEARAYGGAPAPAPSRPAEQRYQRGQAADDTFAAYDFLADPPVLLGEVAVDGDEVRIPRSALGGARTVRVVAVDPTGSAWRDVALPATRLAVRDRRLAEALPADQAVREVRELRVAESGLALPPGARAEAVTTLEPLYRALCALSGDADLARWSFLGRWDALTRDERLAVLDEYACHELSLFVWRHDRALFDEVVRPYLANKLHKTFVDHLLLGDDLRPWTAPDRWASLDAIERALLAHAVDDPAVRAAVARGLADEVDARPASVRQRERTLDVQLVEALLAGAAPAPAPEGGVGGGGRGGPAPGSAPAPMQAAKAKKRSAARSRSARAEADESVEDDIDRERADLADRAEVAELYRGADKTREWAEHGWWHRRPGSASGIGAARLWRDLAAHGTSRPGPFLPTTLADAASTLAGAVVALAMTELPPSAAPDGGPALVAVAAVAVVDGAPTGEALVGQALFQADDRWVYVDGEQREKPLPAEAEVVAGVRYEGQVVLSNPTGRSQALDVLLQIPAGAVAVGGSVATRTTRVHLDPYQTATVEVQFYFPHPGTFVQAGVRVSRGEVAVATAPPRTLRVVAVASAGDPNAWAHVSQRGSLDQVVAFLGRENLSAVPIDRAAWRLRDPEAFARITTALAARLVYVDVVWGYGLLHHDRARVREWLSRQAALLHEIGALDCDLCRTDPLDRGTYHHLEYAPLINARAHPLGPRAVIPNAGLAAQWQGFLERAALRTTLSPADRLEAVHYLLAMDRVEEACALLDRVPASDVDAVLQHDYLSAWVAAGVGDTARARGLSEPHLQHPVARWRRRFSALSAVLHEATGGALDPADRDDREARLAELARREPSLAVRIEGGAVVLDSVNLTVARVRAYPMDVELLFSREPFLAAGGERFTRVEPAVDAEVALDPSGRTVFPLGAGSTVVRRANAVVEVVAGPIRRVVTHLASELVVNVAAPYGRLAVRHAGTGLGLPATYVKVYARMRDGAVVFFKDGYTDLRGAFDYATLSTDELDRVERFAMLVAHDDAGSAVIEAEPPAR